MCRADKILDMNADASWPLQRALSRKLEASARLQALLGPRFVLHDMGAVKPCYPCLLLGPYQTKGWRSHAFDGQEHRIRLIAYNQDGGSDTARRLVNATIGELHDADFPVPGHALVDLQFEFSETRFIQKPGAKTGVFETRMEFKALTVSD